MILKMSLRQIWIYDVPWMTAEEGDPGVSAGRPTGTARVSIC